MTLGEMDAHHRQQRSVGGKDRITNLVGVHRLCHNKIHHDNDYTDGWLVRSWEHPADIEIRLFDGRRLL